MTLANQSSNLPTNKLTASMVGMLLGQVVYAWLYGTWPQIEADLMIGITSAHVFQLAGAFVLGWLTPDRANVPR
jgi:hypothetical protein